MSGKAVIPPVPTQDDLRPEDILQVLSNRLSVAEENADTLVGQMNKLGISQDKVMSPLHGPSASNKYSNLTYDTLVSRICKSESAVQTLKLVLLRVQSQMDLHKTDNFSVEERLRGAKQLHDAEVKKLQKEMTIQRDEFESVKRERNQFQMQVKRLEEALDITSTAKADVAMETEQLNATKVKLQRRIMELKDEANRERSLRASLEDSQNALLMRVKDMESAMDREQQEVKTINTTSNRLKQGMVQSQEELKMAVHQRQQAETRMLELTTQHENQLKMLKSHEDDKDVLLSEFTKMRQKYNELNAKLETMQHVAQETKVSHDKLSQTNKKLTDAMRSAASENAEVVSQYEGSLEKHKAAVADRHQLEEKVRKLEDNLRDRSKEKARLEFQITDLEEKLKRVNEENSELAVSNVESAEKQKHEREAMVNKIKDLEQNRRMLTSEKDCTVEEFKREINRISEERDRQIEESQQAQLELKTLERTKHQMEQENRRLVERIGILEEHQGAQKQVEQTMAELTEQKNKLAYDKGRLQSRVDQLQNDIESLASQSMESVQMKKMNSLLENKLQKTLTDLNSSEMTIQRLETQLKQLQSSGERKEDDFVRVLKARDDVMKEKNKLQEKLDEVEERERQKVQGLQKNVFDAREDNKKMAATLEGLMKTHSRIQEMLEDLQLQLGRRDAIIAQLESEKKNLLFTSSELQRELSDAQNVVSKNEDMETKQVEPLKQALQKTKQDNMKLANSLESVIQSNSQLQAQMQNLEDELEKKSLVMGKVRKAREKDSEDHKQEVKKYEERLQHLREQLTAEREKTIKRNTKDLNEAKKKHEEVISRNGELSRTNQELRHKISEFEMKEKDLQDKIMTQKKKIEYLGKVRHKQDDMLSDMVSVSKQLHDLEYTKKMYMKKNEEQAQMIKQFVAQISNLQSEFKTLVQNQIETAELLKQQEAALAQERKYNEALRKKLKETKKRENSLEQLRQETENRLKEANDETLNIAHTLDDAHSWFKSKFNSLQTEIAQSKKSQNDLELENNDAKVLLALEKQRAEETALKARDMIKASRETISRLADYAELTQKEKNSEMLDLKLRLREEKEASRDTQQQFGEFQESSFRHAELLARELDYLKHKAALFYDT